MMLVGARLPRASASALGSLLWRSSPPRTAGGFMFHARGYAVSAAAIKELRAASGAPITKCKEALEAGDGDLGKAMDWLREKGAATAAKKASRTASDGLIGLAVNADQSKLAIVEVNSETDFVARNDKFATLVLECSDSVLTHSTSGDVSPSGCVTANRGELLTLPHASGHTIETATADAVTALGENIQVRRGAVLELPSSSKGVVAGYVHGSPTLTGRIGTAVRLEWARGDVDITEAKNFAEMMAMHVAAANTLYLAVSNIPQSVLDKERTVLRAQAIESGKKEEFVDKIVEGRLRKYYEETVLLEQKYLIGDGTETVKKVIENTGKALKAENLAVTGFVRFVVGEGIDKEEKSFAEEIQEAGGKL